MKCPICKNELEIKSKKVGESANGDSIFNEFAICHTCKKQWNLDKQRAKKVAEAKAAKEAADTKTIEKEQETTTTVSKGGTAENPPIPTEQPKKKRNKRPVDSKGIDKELPKESTVSSAEERPKKKKKRPVPPEASVNVSDEEQPKPRKKKRPVSDTPVEGTRPVKVKKAAHAMDEPINEFTEKADIDRPKKKKRKPIDNTQKEDTTFSNIPPKHIREEREKEMRQNYQIMLDEGEEDDRGLPTVLIVFLILILLVAAAFAYYWFFIR